MAHICSPTTEEGWLGIGGFLGLHLPASLAKLVTYSVLKLSYRVIKEDTNINFWPLHAFTYMYACTACI